MRIPARRDNIELIIKSITSLLFFITKIPVSETRGYNNPMKYTPGITICNVSLRENFPLIFFILIFY
jgi:hypothetical protein